MPPVSLADDDLLLSLRVHRDIEEKKGETWNDRVIGPLGQAWNSYPKRKHFDPFSANDPNTRDRYYTPEDQKRRVLNPVDEQEIAYIPEGYGEKSMSRSPTLNEEVDQLQQEYDSIPDKNTPIPGLEDMEAPDEKDVGNLETPDTGNVGKFSRPVVRQGMMNLGGPTGTYDELPNSVRREIESQYPGKEGRGSTKSIIGQHSIEDAMAGKAKARFFPEELEELGLDPEDTTWWNNPGHPAWEYFLKAPPAPMPMYKYDQKSGPAMNLGGPVEALEGSPAAVQDAPYIPTGYGESPATDDLVFSKAQPKVSGGAYIPQGYGEDAPINGGMDPETGQMGNKWTGRGRFGGSPMEWGPQKTMQFIQESVMGIYDQLDTLRKAGNIEERIKAAEALELDPATLGLFSDKEAKAGAATAFNMAVAGTARGFTGGLNELGMFGGRLAQGKQSKTLDYAEKALARGDDPQAVKDMTGWYKNEAGQMEFVIDPKQISLLPEPKVYGVTTNKGKGYVAPLSTVIDHPTLFNEFPELAQKGFVQFDKNLKPGHAEYNMVNGLHMIRMHPDTKHPEFISTLAHEINHGLQEINNFARGADYIHLGKQARKELQSFVETGKVNSEFNIPDLIRRQYPKYRPSDEQILTWLRKTRDDYAGDWAHTVASLSQNMGMDLYMRSAGEVKSRLSQSLLQLSDAEIRGMDFSKEGDILLKDRIFSYEPQEQSMSIGKGSGPGGRFTDTEVKEIVGDMAYKRGLDQEHVNKVFEKYLDKGILKEANENVMSDEGLMKIIDREFDRITKATNDDYKSIDKISTGLAQKLKLVSDGDIPSTKMGPIEAEIAKLEKQVREMEGKGRKIVAEDVANWLEMAGVEGVRMVEASTGTKYIKFPDPTVRGDVGQVRVPSDDHRSTRIPSGMLETGTEFTKKPSPSDLRNVEPKAMNAEGGRYSVWENLIDALKWRLSKSPDGQWLVEEGKQPYRRPKAAEAENTGDTISKDPNQLEFDFGTSEMMSQQSQQQQARGGPKVTSPEFDDYLIQLHRSGISYERIGEIVNADRKAKLLDPISSKTIERRIKEFKKLRDEFQKKLEQ